MHRGRKPLGSQGLELATEVGPVGICLGAEGEGPRLFIYLQFLSGICAGC